jgi:hypothetical protein
VSAPPDNRSHERAADDAMLVFVDELAALAADLWVEGKLQRLSVEEMDEREAEDVEDG